MTLKLFRMTLRVAWRSLQRNKLRSVLTMLGVIFGVGAVIAMVAISQGADAFIQAQINSLGTNVVMVWPGSTTSSGAHGGAGSALTLTVADAEAIAKECPSVSGVAYIKRQNMQVIAGGQNWSTQIQGVNSEYFQVRNWPLAAGRVFTKQEEETAARVCLLGQTAVQNLFAPGQDPLGAMIRIQNVPCQVIGVMSVKGQTGWGQDQDDTVLVPFSTAERKLIGSPILGQVNVILVSAYSPALTAQTEQEVRALLRARHRIPTGKDDDFSVRNLQDIAEASASASKVMTTLLASVASIALLVGGIGIMNILLVSVTERTREIGVRMAVGAKARHILLQFLVEAVTLSMIGGLLGVALGIGSARLVASLANWPSLLSPTAVVGSFMFSGIVGVVFGYYPAYKASRLDPIEALRYE
ncbi:MAG TPA: ABC transporter permease [Methylomirabilota bacterium]|jgi:ABC-type antimicrobial peptide transport system permease subunit|nr:ABC transporter permease [Methylomirabilota bacterium]